jgi:hypothetical protein
MEYCDNCGAPLPTVNDRFVVAELPCDIESANKGESAVLCKMCHTECKEDYKC